MAKDKIAVFLTQSAVALSIAFFATFNAHSQVRQTPNFILFIADDISAEDLGCYGHPVMKTPNIDRLAAEGLRFTSAYLTISSCSPSRCSIITGRYPHNTGAPELHTNLPEGQVMFPEMLKNAGYFTILSGKNHMGPAVSKAFSKISNGRGPGREEDWAELLRDRPKDKPFFCWYASIDAHREWTINSDAPVYKPEEVIIPPYLVDAPETRADLTGYYHEVSRFDHYVGVITEQLREEGILDNTVIIVMADNGRPFPRCKTRLYDSGIKTPFVMHAPAHLNPGVTDSLISSIDIAATVLELAGVQKDERIQGVSFVPLLKNHTATVRDVVFAEHNWHVYSNHERMVRAGDWLYIRNNMPDKQNLCGEAYIGGAGNDLWRLHQSGELNQAQSNIFWNPCPPEELYHVRKDPHQLNNVAVIPENQRILQNMRALLGEWGKRTGDSIPGNPTPDRDAPPGAPPKDKKNFRHGEMPGESNNATLINDPGVILLKGIKL